MDFSLSEEQVMIQDSFRGLLERISGTDQIRAVSEGDAVMDKGIWQELVQLGMAGLLISEEHGGAGLGLLEAALVAEELGRSLAPVPYVGTAIMAPLAIMLAGSEVQKQAWLPDLASGEKRLGVALSGAASGVRRSDHVVAGGDALNGKALFVLDCGDADGFVVADDTGGLFVVEADAEGLTWEVFPTIDGTRSVAQLTFNNVPADALDEGSAGDLQRIIDAGRIILAAETLGAGEVMLAQAVDYALQRKQFDRVIGSFQAVKHMCATMAAELQPCRGLVWYAAYAFDHLQDEVSLSAALAKSHVDEVGRMVARTATEVHGGMGYTDLQGLHFWFKRIGFNRAFLGGPEKLRAEAAKLQGLVS
jgi:alkylation response protein AidB-like acyl-CoA dehydrogenase